MKKLIILITIFTASLFCEPIMASTASYQATTELYHVQKKKRKFNTNKKHKRRKHTCLKKSGCRHTKMIKTKKVKCNTF